LTGNPGDIFPAGRAFQGHCRLSVGGAFEAVGRESTRAAEGPIEVVEQLRIQALVKGDAIEAGTIPADIRILFDQP
jgi:hypothetical protein